jgi:hypothetical protein
MVLWGDWLGRASLVGLLLLLLVEALRARRRRDLGSPY